MNENGKPENLKEWLVLAVLAAFVVWVTMDYVEQVGVFDPTNPLTADTWNHYTVRHQPIEPIKATHEIKP